MSAADRLNEIEARANVVTETAPGVLVSEEASLIDRDVPWLIEQVRKRDAALRAVLDLHAALPYDYGMGAVGATCLECTDGTEHPCPTVRAIEEALS